MSEPTYDSTAPGYSLQEVWNRGVGPATLSDEVGGYLVPDGGETEESQQTMESVKHALGDAPDAEL